MFTLSTYYIHLLALTIFLFIIHVLAVVVFSFIILVPMLIIFSFFILVLAIVIFKFNQQNLLNAIKSSKFLALAIFRVQLSFIVSTVYSIFIFRILVIAIGFTISTPIFTSVIVRIIYFIFLNQVIIILIIIEEFMFSLIIQCFTFLIQVIIAFIMLFI